MKRSFKNWVVLGVILLMLLSIGIEVAFAQKYVEFNGRVVSIFKNTLAVKDDKGTTVNFVFGRRTVFDPGRKPNVGERVTVQYYMKRGSNVAYQVKIKAAQ